MSVPLPTLHTLTLTEAAVVKPLLFVFRFNTVPLTPVKAEIIRAMRASSGQLCRGNFKYFNDDFTDAGVLWFLHDDADAAAAVRYPHMDKV